MEFFSKAAGILLLAAIALLLFQRLADVLAEKWDYSKRRLDTDFASLPRAGSSIDRLALHLVEGASRFDLNELATATLLLRRPQKHVPRMLHSITQVGLSYSHRVIKRVQFEDKNIVTWLVPLHTASKDSLGADLQFKCDDKPISTLSISETKSLHVTILTLWRDGFLPLGVEPRHLEDAPIWQALMSAVASDTSVVGSTRAVILLRDGVVRARRHPILTLDALLDAQLNEWLSVGVAEASGHELLFAIRRLARQNVIWGGIARPPNGRSRLEIEFKKHLSLRDQSIYEKVRFRLGLIPRSLTMSLESSLEAESYHLQFTTPEGMYLYDVDARLMTMETVASEQRPRNARSQTLTTRSRISNPTLRSNHLGAGFAHLYARGVSDLQLKDGQGKASSRIVIPRVSFEFREKPPGNLMWAFFFSLYLGSIVWVVGANFNSVFSATGGMPTYWATVLLGLPTILAGLLIARFTSGKIETVSLCTMIAIAYTVVNALFLVGLSALLAMHKWAWAWNGRLGWPSLDLRSIVGDVSSVPWAILMVSSLFNSLLIGTMLFTKGRRYVTRLEAIQ